MPQSLSCVILHIIFSTKHRHPFFTREFAPEVHAYLATLIMDLGTFVYRVGGPADHVHIACSLPREMRQSDLVKKIKVDSSKWVKQQGIDGFYWQTGYGAFSVSKSLLPILIEYIDGQWEHHSRPNRTFKAEYREFLERYEIEYDERYVWD
jgi:REP element-mobilizing transposase RayT